MDYPEGARMLHRPTGRYGHVVRRMPPNMHASAEMEDEPVTDATYEVDFGGEDNELAAHGDLAWEDGGDPSPDPEYKAAGQDAQADDGGAAEEQAALLRDELGRFKSADGESSDDNGAADEPANEAPKADAEGAQEAGSEADQASAEEAAAPDDSAEASES